MVFLTVPREIFRVIYNLHVVDYDMFFHKHLPHLSIDTVHNFSYYAPIFARETNTNTDFCFE